MRLATTIRQRGYSFESIKEVLARANPPKSGDDLAGVGARDEVERIRTLRTKFLRESLTPWVGEFARRIRQGTREDYFLHLAECLDALVAGCEEAVSSSLPETEATT